ncbi:MAG TPA: aldo/keto reductase [Vicinamibacteria bacterium]|nr:aldo/keto reductase [Vicinamibacteria bacterium]
MGLPRERRPLGRTGVQVTRLGIGDLADRSLPLETCAATLCRALDAGLDLVDTAPMYEDGYSEAIVGRALAGRRHGVFVIDKIDHLDQPVGPQVADSLQRLALPSLDLLVFHSCSTVESWERLLRPGGGFDQLDAERKAGRARFVGISSHHPDVLQRAIASGRCDVLMFPIGPFVDRRYETEILPEARRRGVGTVCFKTFGAGKLLGDTEGYQRPLTVRPRGKRSSGGTDDTGSLLPRLSVADCLHYTLTVDPDVALLGLSYPNEQDAAFAAAESFRPLTADQMEDVRRRAGEAIAGKGACWWNPPDAVD